MLYYTSGSDPLSWIYLIFFVIVVVSCCCAGEGGSSGSKTSTRKNTNNKPKRNNYYGHCSYGECPSCGAPYFDGYCEECGYPDINQGWLGENY